MTRIAQTIDINVPAQVVFDRLRQFETYPEFMQDIEEVRRLDDGHLHWFARMQGRDMEWDSEITEQQPGRCIAWRNTSGPANTGRVDLEPIGKEKARVTLTMECDPAQLLPAQAGDAEVLLSNRLESDLARFKDMVESDASGTATSSPSIQAGGTTQSEASLSRTSDDEASEQGTFNVAAEQSFDQQSDQARRVGQMPEDINAAGGMNPSEAMSGTILRPASPKKPPRSS